MDQDRFFAQEQKIPINIQEVWDSVSQSKEEKPDQQGHIKKYHRAKEKLYQEEKVSQDQIRS